PEDREVGRGKIPAKGACPGQCQRTMNSVAVIQMNSTAEVETNLSRARQAIEQAAEAGCILAVLPECFACMPGTSRDRRRALEEDGAGPVQNFLSAMASRLHIWLVGGTVTLRADDERAAAAVLVYDDSGHRRARYDKSHLFDVAVTERG